MHMIRHSTYGENIAAVILTDLADVAIQLALHLRLNQRQPIPGRPNEMQCHLSRFWPIPSLLFFLIIHLRFNLGNGVTPRS